MPRHFHTKIRGISREQSRQDAAANTRIAEQVVFSKPDPALPDYPHALEIWNQADQCLGFLSDSLAIEADEKIKRGYRYVLIVKDLTGGTPLKPTRGVNLLVVQCEPGEGQEEAAAYLNTLIARDDELAAVMSGASASPVEPTPRRVEYREYKSPVGSSFNPLKTVSAASLGAAKGAWARFDAWCGGYEIEEGDPLSATAEEMIKIIKSTGPVFEFDDACEFIGIAEAERGDVAQLVFREITRRAWADHVLDKNEKQTLSWLYSRLDLEKDWARSVIKELRP
jgi:hypothetical protein